MRPDSPTHEQGLQEEQKSDQQDEISIEQSLADDQDTNLSTGPMPSSDFTAPEEPHTDPNRILGRREHGKRAKVVLSDARIEHRSESGKYRIDTSHEEIDAPGSNEGVRTARHQTYAIEACT
eukprot:g77686.t1